MKASSWVLVLLILLPLAGGLVFVGWQTAKTSPRVLDVPPVEVPEDAASWGRRPVFLPQVEVLEEKSGRSAELLELNREGCSAFDARDFERARELFERCFELDPDEDAFRSNLAQTLIAIARRDRAEQPPCRECTEMLERALELRPEIQGLSDLLERWRREDEAEEGFWRDSSLHFDLAFDGERSELLHGSHTLLAVLEQAYIDLGEFFGARPVEEGLPRIQVVLYRRDRFDAVTGLGDWAAGAFDGTVRVPVEDLAAERELLRRVLRHELVHAFIAAIGGPKVPGWLNEGLAQWLEGEPSAVERARAKLEGVELFPLEKLGGSLASWGDVEAVAAAYNQSLALCDHLARRFGQDLLVRMVEGCSQGIAPEETFERAARFRLDLCVADLAEEL